MAGFDNEVLYAVGERLQPSNAQAIGIMQGTPGSTNVSIINYTGNPQNNVSANPSSLSHDSVSGNLYLKVSGTGTTEWRQIVPASGTVITLQGTTGGKISPDVTGNIFILGGVNAAGTLPVSTAGTTNTITVNVQRSQAIAATDSTKVGLSVFNSAQFTVDANGFVSTSGTGVANTITGQSGAALSPTLGNWNIFGASTAAGTSPVVTSGSGSTLTVNVQKAQAIASTDATKVGLSNFNSAQFTVDANGFVSTSGTGVLQTLTGNTGGAVAPVSNNINVITANSTPIFNGSGNTLTLDFNKENLLLGSSLGVVTAFGNVGIGGGILGSPLAALTSGEGNVAIGSGSGLLISIGDNNCLFGSNSGKSITSATQNVGVGSSSLSSLQTGGSNTAIGQATLSFLTTGSRNIAIGITSGAFSSGQGYNGAESSNIVIGNIGVNGESNVIRIGTDGTALGKQNAAYIAGITNSTVAASAPTGVASTGQLSSLGFGTSGQVLTSTGAASSPTWQSVGSPSPTTTVFLKDDFIGSSLSPSSGSNLDGELSWLTLSTTSLFTPGSSLSSTAHPGVAGSSAISVGSPLSCLFLGANAGSAALAWPLGGGVLTIDWIFNVNVPSNVTNRYTLRLGMGSTITNADQVNGAYFEYSDNINSGNWNYKTAKASTRTTNNSSTAVTAGWHHATMSIDAAATSISFTMDGVSLGAAIITNIPTAAITPFLQLGWVAGTVPANAIGVDLFYANQTLTTTR